MKKLTFYVKTALVWLGAPLIVVAWFPLMERSLVGSLNEDVLLSQNKYKLKASDGKPGQNQRECESDFHLLLAIAKEENCANFNNPTCLIFVGQAGAIRHRSGFAIFPDREAGWEAGLLDIRAKRRRRFSDRTIAERWNLDASVAYVERVMKGCRGR